MNWFFILSISAIVLYIVYWYLNHKTGNKEIRILKWIIFCIATISLGGSAIIKIKEALLENDSTYITMETTIIMLCIVFLGIGITGIKKSITDNHDSQKWVIFYQKKLANFHKKIYQ